MKPPSEVATASARVIVADDEAVIRMGLRSMLEAAGHEIVGEASTADEVFDLAQGRGADVVLLDVMMPGMDTLQAARILAKDFALQVVFVSAFSDPGLRSQAAAAGAAAYVVKPVRDDQLLAAIAAATGRKITRPDYHTHLENYGLSRDAVLRLCDAALAAGVTEIGITEHAYHFRQCREIYPKDNAWIHGTASADRHEWDLEAYVALLAGARDEGLPVKMAMEWDYCPGQEAALERLVRAYDWDFTLGSVHWLPGRGGGWWGFDMPQEAAEWQHRSADAVYAEYFRFLSRAAGTGLFDILAHPDVIKVFGHRAHGDLAASYTETAQAVARSGACVEISTAGWRKPVGELYPADAFLAALRRSGVPVVISSDAHVAEHIGYEFDRAEAIVRSAGYATRCVFTRRQRREVPLP